MADLRLAPTGRPLRAKPVTASGWGRHPRAQASAFRPEDPAEAAFLVAAAEGPLLPVGGGRAYGDQGLTSDGRLIRTERLNRLLALDATAPAVECEAGVTFGELLQVMAPHGLAVPVSPGTRFVTLGGAIASDVHGKNHDRVGALGQHLDWLDLLLADGSVRRVSPQAEPALFAATVGGCGLTGIVLRARLRLLRLPSQALEVTYRRQPDLAALMAALAEARRSAAYSVAWIDALARGRSVGRGILETAEPAPGDPPAAAEPARQRLTVPVELPGGLLNRASVSLFNQLYYRRIPAAGRRRRVPLGTFLYPLDAIGRWNRMYGPRGFHQFQCVLPDDQGEAGLAAMLQRIADGGLASFLAVLKTLGEEGVGHLSFPRRGFTLALDIPRRAGSAALLGELERLTLAHGGRVYLTKDSALSAEAVPQMYPRLPAFRRVLAEVDPAGRWQSDLARRLRLRGGP